MISRDARLISVCLLTLSTTLAACGASSSEVVRDPKALGCPTGSAIIMVSDGFLETICGCAEASPTYAPQGQALTCTVPTGTAVFFEYIGTGMPHQILSTGTPSFPPSPLSDPSDPSSMVRVHTVKLTLPGTYTFHDAINPTLSGQLIAL
jgi:hypothetical protein